MGFFHIRAAPFALRKIDNQIDTLYSYHDVFLSFAGSSFLRNLIAAPDTSAASKILCAHRLENLPW